MSKVSKRPTILICNGALWPGNDASGPNLSVKLLAEGLRGDYRVLLLARDRPFGAAIALPALPGWNDAGFAEARYCAVSWRGANGLAEILRQTPHDVLWLNGFFDREFTIPALLMRKFGRVPARPVILSPRGEFASGALGLKSAQKSAYLALARRTGLLAEVCLHATSEAELTAIKTALASAGSYAVAPNFRPLVPAAPAVARTPGAPLQLAFIGRISPVKNLDYAVAALRGVRTGVHLNIYGPIQDNAYWGDCLRLAITLPPHVTIQHHGEITNNAVAPSLAANDLLFLPTKGENFGHAIFEALSCGVPVLISDQTPWRGLQQSKAGWDLPLADPAGFAAAIDAFAAFDGGQRAGLRQGARSVAERHAATSEAGVRTREMLSHMLASMPARVAAGDAEMAL